MELANGGESPFSDSNSGNGRNAPSLLLNRFINQIEDNCQDKISLRQNGHGLRRRQRAPPNATP
jgi:hypothetical protein